MKNKVIGGLLLTAAIGSQVSAVAAEKLGNLTFALTDNRQQTVSVNGNANAAQANGSVTALLDSVAPWDDDLCDALVKYESKSTKVDTKYVINAIGKAIGKTFDPKAQLILENYDNELPAPPYPPYINPAGIGDDMLNVFNGPRDDTGALFGGYLWPNELQIDWVNYALAIPVGDVDPKARVYVFENKANGACLEVSPFFSIEEAYCYHCWDTVGRVTKGQLSTKDPSAGDPCVGGGGVGCGLSGNGKTQYYLTVNFNNILSENVYLDTTLNGTDYNDYLIAEGFTDVAGQVVKQVAFSDELQFTVAGVVNYSWKIKPIAGVAAALGTHSIAKAEGYGDLGNRCGVFTGSVKITETDKLDLPCND
jgi:hypothetical protein